MKAKALLMGLLITGAGLVSAEEATLTGLRKEFENSMDELREKYQKAKTKEEKQEILKERPDAKETVKAMLPLFEKEGDDPKVLEQVVWVMQVTRGDVPEGVMDLVTKHRETKEIKPIVLMAGAMKDGPLAEVLKWAREESPHMDVRGVAAYARTMGRGMPEEEKLKELRFAVEHAGDYEMRGKPLRERAEGALYEAEHLQIGQVAGEIEGEDQEGVKFKLSDYRGKVVVLDFWGDW
mgnify:CR=1 FL=1|jgi:hypothetical protein|tara:strand:+ start:759 stop:1469 length:711 start_codon:yes stop_codon:yes gene_type:complete